MRPDGTSSLNAIWSAKNRHQNAGRSNAKSVISAKTKTMKNSKRITLPVSPDIELIRNRLLADTGVKMTYTQVFNFLIHFYVERANEPKTKWKSLN
jgi:hypothetical protein